MARRLNQDCSELMPQYKRAIKKAKKQSWQSFCSDTSDSSGVAKLTKIINAKDNKALGLLSHDDGTYTASPEETVDLLMNTHFPGSIVPGGTNDTIQGAKLEITSQGLEDSGDISFIDTIKVQEAIRTFGPLKAAGPDGFKPIALQIWGQRRSKG